MNEEYYTGIANAHRVRLIKEDVKRVQIAERARLRKEVEGLQALHNHDSIPNYTSNLEEGCIVCVANSALQSVLNLLKE